MKWTCTGCWSVNFPGTSECQRCGAPRAFGRDDAQLLEVEELLAELVDVDPEDYWVAGAWDLEGLRSDVGIQRQQWGAPQPGAGDRAQPARAGAAGSAEPLATAAGGLGEAPQPGPGAQALRQAVALAAEARLLRHQLRQLALDLQAIRGSLAGGPRTAPPAAAGVGASELQEPAVPPQLPQLPQLPHLQPLPRAQAPLQPPVQQPAALPRPPPAATLAPSQGMAGGPAEASTSPGGGTAPPQDFAPVAPPSPPAPPSNAGPLRPAPKLQVDARGGISFNDGASGSPNDRGSKWQDVLLMLERLHGVLSAKSMVNEQ